MSRESLLRSSPGGRMVSIPLLLSQNIQSFVSCSTFTFSRYPQCRFAGRKIETSDEYQVETQEYQGGATAILQILKTQVNLFFKTIWNGTINKN